MSSGNVFERLFKLWASVCKLILDGKRETEEVCRVLQAIVDGRQLVEATPTLQDMLADWAKFYKDVFGLDLDFSGVKIPERKPGFDRLLVIAKGMTCQRLFDKCKELFPSWKYTDSDLDQAIKSDRTAQNGHYAVWVRDRVEAEEENRNLSADDLKERNFPGITLEERTLYELKFFKETGRHLDNTSYTLCTGSRSCGGYVPGASWCGVVFEVSWNFSSFRGGGIRARSAVSSPA